MLLEMPTPSGGAIWIKASTLILILLGVVVALSLLAFVVYRLYKLNRQKSITFAAKAHALAQEIKTNKTLTELLHNIFESSLHGIIAFSSVRNKKGDIIDFNCDMVNHVAANIVDKKTADMLGKTLLNLFPGNKDSGLFDEYINVVLTAKPFQTVVYYNHDEMEIWFSISAVKNMDGFIVTFSDISEIKSDEQLLINKQKALEEANDDLEQFAYIASHDLQEPLRKIRAFGDRLDAGYADKLDDKGQDYIARMRSASARMQTLIDDLLKFSRATRSPKEMSQVDLNEVLSVVKDLLFEPIQETNALISKDPLPTILGNESQMIQLFQNILSNSLKYASVNTPAQITISVTDTVLSHNKVATPFWLISIKDNGIGFGNEHKDKIFEIFQRLHGRTEYAGTGIGLAICAKIVSHHEGFIAAQSEPGQGAEFLIHLPKISSD